MATQNMVVCNGCGKEIHKTAASCPQCGANQRKSRYKSKVAAGVLAILLGNLGIHRFYLGQWWGIFYILFFWTFIPGVIALIEGVVFLVRDQQKWDEKYNEGQGSTSGESSAVWIIVAVIAVFMAIAIMGILAAIAIPAYQDYTMRARVAESLQKAEEVKTKATEFIIAKRVMPASNTDLGLPNEMSSQFVSSISVTPGGVIVIQYSAAALPLNQKTLTLEPIIGNNELRWICTGGTVEKRYRPRQCQ